MYDPLSNEVIHDAGSSIMRAEDENEVENWDTLSLEDEKGEPKKLKKRLKKVASSPKSILPWIQKLNRSNHSTPEKEDSKKDIQEKIEKEKENSENAPPGTIRLYFLNLQRELKRREGSSLIIPKLNWRTKNLKNLLQRKKRRGLLSPKDCEPETRKLKGNPLEGCSKSSSCKKSYYSIVWNILL
jgi:hypothetical protein